jgi:hypothetical protein
MLAVGFRCSKWSHDDAMMESRMDLDAVAARVKALFQELQTTPDEGAEFSRGLACDRTRMDDGLNRLQCAVQDLRIEAERLADRERELLETLRCKSPAQIVHAVRNLQNDVVLLAAMLRRQDAAESEAGADVDATHARDAATVAPFAPFSCAPARESC